jgi:hypothetical protein
MLLSFRSALDWSLLKQVIASGLLVISLDVIPERAVSSRSRANQTCMDLIECCHRDPSQAPIRLFASCDASTEIDLFYAIADEA